MDKDCGFGEEMIGVLVTVNSFTLSNTSEASESFEKTKEKVSNVRECSVNGLWP